MAGAVRRQRVGSQHLQRFHLLAVAQAYLAEIVHARLGLDQDLVFAGLDAGRVGLHFVIGPIADVAEAVGGLLGAGGFLWSDAGRLGLCGLLRMRIDKQSQGQQQYSDQSHPVPPVGVCRSAPRALAFPHVATI